MEAKSQADQEISLTSQDDVLLSNNAVEAGASSEDSKKNKCLPEKRKFDDVRQECDAKQKRICSEPLESTDPAVSIGQKSIENTLPHSLEEKTALEKNFSEADELGQLTEFGRNILEADGMEELPSISHQTQKGAVSGSSGFINGKVLNLTMPDRGASFHSSSTPSDSPVWSPIEGFSTPEIPDMGTSDIYESVTNELGFNTGLSEVTLENHQLLCGALRNSVVRADDYMVEISNSIFDFSNEEDNPLMSSDIDGLSSLLLDSPSQNGQERPSDLNPEYRDGVICCVLNMEDRDVPCNDDVFLHTGPSLSKSAFTSEMQGQKEEPPSVPQKVNAGDLNQVTNERNSLEQFPVAEETLQNEEDPENSDVDIMF